MELQRTPRFDIYGANPPHNETVDGFIPKYEHIKTGEHLKDVEVSLQARVFTKRESGSRLVFYDVWHRGGKLQIMCQAQEAAGPLAFGQQHEHIRRNDWIWVTGYPGRTAPRNRPEGELSLFARELRLLTPSLHQLPSDFYGFKNQEQRHRQRYLDWIVNQSSVDNIRKRSDAIFYIRRYFHELGFIEAETPILTAQAGGATAKPFMTHHNELNTSLCLRIAPELYLKQMIVGGFDRVFEIGKQFRNEGIDLTHNPEFTTCEFYMAHSDVFGVLKVTEDLVPELVKHVTGSYETKFDSRDGEEYLINWAKPWKQIEMMPALEEACGEKFPPATELHTKASTEFLKRILKKMNVECSPPQTNARMLDKLVSKFIEEKIVNPTFIMNHPQIMSPLAKEHRHHPGLSERFEAFVCKMEIINAYSEQNNPFAQRAAFEEQAKMKAQGDDEVPAIDESFIKALEFGLPPTGGWGLGIDRLVMFLTNNYSIKEVLSFPFMKDNQDQSKDTEGQSSDSKGQSKDTEGQSKDTEGQSSKDTGVVAGEEAKVTGIT